MSKTITWLHISDLHAGKPKDSWDVRRITHTLVEDLKRMESEQDLHPDLIFFTGDAAFGEIGSGPNERLAAQYKLAQEFLDSVRQAFSPAVPLSDLFLVPGNHDVNRYSVTEMETDWIDRQKDPYAICELIQEKGLEWQRFMERLEDYRRFLESNHYEHLLADPERLIYAIVREVKGVTIGIGGFNSAWSCCRDNEKGNLWMGSRWQLERILAELGHPDISIALFHHPADWLVEQEGSHFWRQLENDFSCVLHGHEHEGWVATSTRGHTRVAAGACYDRSDKENGYNFVRLDLDAGNGRVWLRRYDDTGGGWIPRAVYRHTTHDGVWKLDHLNWLRPTSTSPVPIDPPPVTPRLTIGWRKREDIAPAEWLNIFSHAKQRIWLLGHSMLKTMDPRYSGGAFAERLAAGVDVRLVVLDPYDVDNFQINEIAQEIKESDLRRKIKDTLRFAMDLAANGVSRFSIGITQANIHNSIVIVDDRFLVTLYSHNWEMGNAGITFDLTKENPQEKRVCDFFERDFVWHWRRSLPFFDEHRTLPRIELRILNYVTHTQSSFRWYEDLDGNLTFPHIVVINPTYVCRHGTRASVSAPGESPPSGPFSERLLCPNCMYGELLNPPQQREMSVHNFATLCADLSRIGVGVIEVSGGGEPLHHSHAPQLMEQVRSMRETGTCRAQVGLLANVAALSGCDFPSKILRAMSYIRWSWPEGAELQPTLHDRYLQGLRDFLALRESLKSEMPKDVRIGVKVLVTHDNATRERPLVVTLVRELFALGVDHVKVRALRSNSASPSLDQRRHVEDALARLSFQLQEEGIIHDTKSLEVDVRERKVPPGYHCKISTLISAIEPNGDVRMCWNDLRRAQSRVIGNVFEEGGFERVWGSRRHWDICQNMDSRLVCNSEYGCDCRMVGYQETVERLMRWQVLQERDSSPLIRRDGFL